MALSVPAAAALSADDDKVVGEFAIPTVIPLDGPALNHLRRLVRNDPEAARLAKAVAADAAPHIGAEPTPLAVIHYEGLVNTNPKRIATVAKLRQMGHTARLMRYWQTTGDEKTAATLKAMILAWSKAYRPTGNDVNENKFYPLLVSYHGLRDTFTEAERKKADDWVERLGVLHGRAVDKSRRFNNRYGKHVRLLAICGMILGRDAWVEKSHEGVRRFVTNSLYADGSSFDLKHRDTLTYHGSALKPVIELAMLAGDDGPALYSWQNPEGGSIKKSVDLVVPYAMGEKTRKEWVNTKVQLDRRRAAAGLEKYRTGRLYDPMDALDLMERAS
ncbi:MAG: alginate lyase family protein, partial [Phycisphaeraceae bacterium]|nr:alginate lyase family protein [Phycisphaeraceae bacterium]